MKTLQALVVVASLAVVSFNCGSGVVDESHDGAPDAGGTDAAVIDAGAADAGTPDAGTADAGAEDAGSGDAGAPDAGSVDAGTPDAGSPDAGIPDTGPTTTIAAATCEASAVQAALTQAANTPGGATVVLPAGTCDWGSTTVSVTLKGAPLRLRGAGRDATIIRRTQAGRATNALEIDCRQGGRVSISHLGFRGNASGSGLDGAIQLRNGCVDFKIHDIRATKFVMSGVDVRGSDARGVIFDSEFIDNYDPSSPGNGWGYGVVIYGDDTPTRVPLTLGGPQAVFVEDNVIKNNRHGVASNTNSRYVVRHNYFSSTNVTRGTQMIDAHGRSSSANHGSRSWEIYENTLYYDGDDYAASGIGLRGGDGVVLDNFFSGSKTTTDRNFTIRFAVSFSREDGCGNAPDTFDSTTEAWIADNTWDPRSRGGEALIGYSPTACDGFLHEGQQYSLSRPPNYTPYTYPHPLRLDGF